MFEPVRSAEPPISSGISSQMALSTRPEALRVAMGPSSMFVHGGIPPRVATRGASLDQVNRLARETLDARSYEIAFDDALRNYYGHSDEGPFWYRGYHRTEAGRYPQATAAQVDSVLDAYAARAIVVGHTGVAQVSSLYQGKVYALDIPLETLGAFQALLWTDDRFFRVTADGSLEPLAPTVEGSPDRSGASDRR